MITTFHLPWLHQFLSLCVRVRVCVSVPIILLPQKVLRMPGTHTHIHRESGIHVEKMRAKEAE